MKSKRELITEAKRRVNEIAKESENVLPDHCLVIAQTPLGPDLSQVWDGWTAYLECLDFGSRKLSLKKVKERIQEAETHEFVMS